jgi:hypothetical protein
VLRTPARLTASVRLHIKTTGVAQCFNFVPTASAATRIFPRSQLRLVSAPLNARSASLVLRTYCRASAPIAAANSLHAPGALLQSLLHTQLQPSESTNQKAAAKQPEKAPGPLYRGEAKVAMWVASWCHACAHLGGLSMGSPRRVSAIQRTASIEHNLGTS